MSDEKQKSNARDSELLGIQNIMKNEDGRNFMYNQLQYCGVYGNIFSNDTNQHSFNAGKREAGLQLERELKEAAPGEYLKMIGEHLNE